MVKPSWRWFTLGAAGIGLAAGCGIAPRAQLDDCHQRSRTLQAENSRLKDQTLSLKTRNQDLTRRSVDDARRLRVQDDSIQRLGRSVVAYQNERDQMAAAYERLKGQIQVSFNPRSASTTPPSASSPSTTLEDRFAAFAHADTRCAYDAGEGVLSVPVDRLFEAGTDRLTPDGRAWLRACAELLAAPEARDLDLRVVGHATGSTVLRAGVEPSDAAHGRFLSLARATRVRDTLAASAPGAAPSIRVAGPEAARLATPDPHDPADRRIEIQLRPR